MEQLNSEIISEETKKQAVERVENRAEKPEDFLMSPKVDFCFKELMQSAKVRKGIIAALLGEDPEAIESTELQPTILRQEYPDDKYGILDVLVKLKDGVRIDFEMQVVPFEFWTQRVLFYWSKMYVDQIKKGDPYETLKKCIHVSILDFAHFTDDEECYHKIGLYDFNTGKVYSDLMELHILELGKLPPEDQNESGLIRWMRFLNGKSREEFEEMAEKDEYIGEAYELLKNLSADEKKRIAYEYREKSIKDYNSQMLSAERRGQEEGERIGEERGIKIGEERGRKAGEEKLGKLIEQLTIQGREKEILKAATDEVYREVLFEEFRL